MPYALGSWQTPGNTEKHAFVVNVTPLDKFIPIHRPKVVVESQTVGKRFVLQAEDNAEYRALSVKVLVIEGTWRLLKVHWAGFAFPSTLW